MCRWQRKKGPKWQAEKGQQCGYAMAKERRGGAGSDAAGFSGRMALQRIRWVGPVGLAFELQNDGVFDQAIEESHGQRTV